jgi:type I restriction enzyme R subunit
MVLGATASCSEWRYFAPASGLNPDTMARYQANRLSVTRQLHYSANEADKSLDLVLSLNGLPIATLELKNPLTGQTWRNAVTQYKKDRNPNDLIFQFGKRALVHFAVDPDEVYMTTRLAGKATYFLPFNRGRDGGAGNPDNRKGYSTSYLWEQVLQRDSLLDILHRFMHLEEKEKESNGRKYTQKTMIFPRYHQLDAVRKMVTDAREIGSGKNYLVQHSAGSGKSNSIAWLAYRLHSLHDDQNQRVFDSVVVITDRRVLDSQLQNTIYQFDHTAGVVHKIEKDSTQLANALSSGAGIIITTLQKFPFVTEKMNDLPKRSYAVIVDEAHSSQGGETANELKKVLGGLKLKEEARKQAEDEGMLDYEEVILLSMAARGKQPNISFFAFTATPKYKTLEVFGQEGADGKPEPFHLYSMRQAIEEEFILDVLKNYITYKTYYRLVKAIEDDPQVAKKAAAKALARFMSLHPHNISQKTQVMLEHFRKVTKPKIGGKAKAMVVTSSRLHAVRYKEAFDKYIKAKGYDDIKTLVAFSGTVIDDGNEYTEVGMNQGIKERELPERFASKDYQVLLVAEKYQTGFDQPLLHTMFVDKRLKGIHAVQTLSRLNRRHPGKEETFVLDFVNEPGDIQEAFQPFYEQTMVGEQAEPSQLYDLQAKLESSGVFYPAEVDEFAKVFFKPSIKHRKIDQSKLYAILSPAVSRFKDLEENERDEFRKTMTGFRNLYSFISQVMPFQDIDLEKLYVFSRMLLNKLKEKNSGPTYSFDDDVALQYYRLQKIREGDIELIKGESGKVDGPLEVGTGKKKEDEIELSQLIDILNERFGTEFTTGDQLFFDSIKADSLEDEDLKLTALNNTLEGFGYKFAQSLEERFTDRIEMNEDIVGRFMDNRDFRQAVTAVLTRQVYEQIRAEAGQ